MATRPDSFPAHVTYVSKIVKSGSTVTEGVGVKVSSGGELEVDLCGANDKAFGIAMATVLGDGTKTVEVALLNGGGVIPVKCSGTATAGEYAICGSGGFENQTVGGGTTVKYLAGKFTQSGSASDYVGLALGQFAAGCA
jgi:hypothetical protein